MCRWIARLGGVVLVGLLALGVVFLAGMRAKSPTVLSAVRRTNRAFWNPRAMQTAGTPGAYASIIHHVGRVSGEAYQTPVGVIAVDDGFLIVLPYGRQADWLKNVLASGRATIVHDGETHDVDQPAVVPTSEVLDHFAAKDQRNLRLFRIDEVLRLRTVEHREAPHQVANEVADPA